MSSSQITPSHLIYACIAHNSTILTEHISAASPQASSLASIVLPKISHTTPNKLTYTHNSNFIHFIADSPSQYAPGASAGELTYLVVADSALGRRIPFQFLDEVKKVFLEKYPAESTDFSCLPVYGAGNFNVELQVLTKEFSATQGGEQDTIRNVREEIDSVRGIMCQNIDSLLERGERIDLLIDKTNRLGGNAYDFRIRTRGLRRKMWWNNVKLVILLIFVILFLVYLFVGFGCGLPGWSKCIGSRS
ncbi:unnamed protein product [Blumeria hordei]|uniref:Synaptobrevin homolog YKT6 n=1 Tax=Blumeria hordei TaxID=2867405 RepID=A0A383UIH6_BLUHO|nr:unnamed protein product [Blumeria hordei]